MTLKDTDKLIELIDDDIASLDMNMPTESYYACLCTLQMVKLYIKALSTADIDAITKAHADIGYEQGYRDGCAESIEIMAAKEQKAYNKGYEDGMAQCVTDFGLVSVVRCIDCKYHEEEELGMVWCPYIVGSWVENDFYCANGERKDEVEE